MRVRLYHRQSGRKVHWLLSIGCVHDLVAMLPGSAAGRVTKICPPPILITRDTHCADLALRTSALAVCPRISQTMFSKFPIHVSWEPDQSYHVFRGCLSIEVKRLQDFQNCPLYCGCSLLRNVC